MIDVERPLYVPARYFHPGRIKPVELIVVHSMEALEKGTTAEAVARYFQDPPVQASAHYCIDNDSLVQCVYDRDTAWHCANANANGLGLEHAGYAKQTEAEWLDAYGKSMLDISARLAAYLCHKFNIPVQRAVFSGPQNPQVKSPGFCGHNDVPKHGLHSDPGVNFPWGWYLDRVRTYHGGTR